MKRAIFGRAIFGKLSVGKAAFVVAASLALSACAHRYPIDHSYQAIGKSSRIEYIILHYTAEDHENSLAVLTGDQVSSHYLIGDDRDEVIYQLVEDDSRAWHAGRSEFGGKTALNDISIGIEIVNAGIDAAFKGHRGYLPQAAFVDFSDKQIDKTADLLARLVKKYDILPTNILAHSDIAPSRKIDPGAKFPWRYLYEKHGLGAWYDEADKQAFLADLQENFNQVSVRDIKNELKKYGYAINDSDEWDRASQNVVYAFQLHFRAENPTGVMDRETLAILRALNKKYRSEAE